MLGEFVQSPRTIHNTTLARHMTTVLANPVRPSTRVAFAMAGFSLLAYLPARTRAARCSNRCFSHRPAKVCKQRIQLPMRRQQHGMSAAEVRQHRTGLTSHCYKLKAQTLRYPTGTSEKGTNSEFVLGTFFVLFGRFPRIIFAELKGGSDPESNISASLFV